MVWPKQVFSLIINTKMCVGHAHNYTEEYNDVHTLLCMYKYVDIIIHWQEHAISHVRHLSCQS